MDYWEKQIRSPQSTVGKSHLAIFFRFLNYFLRLFEQSFLKNQQYKHSDCDCRIGDIEYVGEEFERFSAYERKPIWPGGAKNGKKEHVNHFAVQKRSISASGRKQYGFVEGGAFAEDEAEKSAVENIAYGARKNQRYGNDQKCRGFLFNQSVQIPDNGCRSDDTDEA
jgi:hypothetical protein